NYYCSLYIGSGISIF
nr:immunoglobulin light chain junction region [Macaca mulatta]